MNGDQYRELLERIAALERQVEIYKAISFCRVIEPPDPMPGTVCIYLGADGIFYTLDGDSGAISPL